MKRLQVLSVLLIVGIVVTGHAQEYGETFRDRLASGGLGPEMVVIPEGSFTMGSAQNERLRETNEGPTHRVTISRPFALGRMEITYSEWDTCLAAGGCDGYRPRDFGWGRGDIPVVDVNWQHVQAFVSWLSSETGEQYRLPSESEWEYAARARTSTRFVWGNEIAELNRANCKNCGSEWDERQPAPVGSFQPNAFGVYDMHGNVVEWTADCHNISYRGAPNDGSAWMSGQCQFRSLRGGSYWQFGRYLRSASRSAGSTNNTRGNHIGFRVARTLVQ